MSDGAVTERATTAAASLGLFGKLPARRDFVAFNAPPAFLHPWETWLQSAVSASRSRLGAEWPDHYMTAPLWRFSLGREALGAAALGVFMPSLDGVGRYFPLSLFALAPNGHAFPDPAADAQDAWFDAAEALLLSTLEPEVAYEATLEALQALAPPALAPDAPADAGVTRLDRGLLVRAEGDLSAAFVRSRAAEAERALARGTNWWTIGGEDFPAQILSLDGLPDPYLLADMLTGRFAPAGA